MRIEKMKIINDLTRGILFAGVALSVGLGAAEQTMAQAASNGASGLEEIIVTARRREESLQAVPVSVQAFSAETLERNNILNFEDIASRTPGMVYSFSSGVDNEIFMRGIGTDIQGAAADNSVGIFVDGIYMPRSTGTQLGLYDLERVEVLKGPQSLRFGKNVVGGLIHYVTKKPTDEFEGDLSATLGDYNEVNIAASARGPVSDTVSFSVAGGSNQRDGYGINTRGPDADDMNRSGARAQILISPSESLDILFAADYNRTRAAGRWVDLGETGDSHAVTFNGFFADPLPELPGFVLPTRNEPFANSNPRKGARNHTGSSNSDLAGVSATIDWDNGNGLSIQSITALRDNEVEMRDDGCGIFWDFPMAQRENGLQVPDPADAILGAAGDVLVYLDDVPDCWFDQYKTDNAKAISQELRFSVEAGDKTTLAGGVYYLDEDIDRTEQVAFSFPDFSVITEFAGCTFGGATDFCGPPTGLVETEGVSFAETRSDSTNLGVFLEADIAFSERFSLNAGLRWVRDDKDFSVARSGDSFDEQICEPDDQGVLPPGCAVQGEFVAAESQSWNELLPALSLRFTPSDSTTLYVRYERGYKPGGYTGEGAGQPSSALVSFDPEFSNAFEAGAKMLLADNRVRLNIATHFTDYEDLQTQQFIAADPTRPPDNFVVNASDGTEAYGVEVDFEAAVSDAITLYGNYAFTKCEFSGELIIDDDGTDIDGNTCRRTPENAINVGGHASIPLASSRVFTLGANYQWQDDYFFNNENTPIEVVDSEYTVNAHAGLGAEDGTWHVNFWVKNVTDELNMSNVFELFGTVYLNYQAPRTYGVTYRHRF